MQSPINFDAQLKISLIKQNNYVYVLGDVPCIVSSGEGGFIPIRFLSGSTVQMSGHSKHQLANTWTAIPSTMETLTPYLFLCITENSSVN